MCDNPKRIYDWIFRCLLLSVLFFQRTYCTFLCDEGSCLPGTGNLLIGRANRLTASSTCGVRGPEKFYVEGKHNSFACDARMETDYRFYHKIENVIPKSGSATKLNWWQSENGVENVTIQLDLETEFYVMYVYIKFKTFLPAAALVERSSDNGQTWKVYRYFAVECSKFFPFAPKGEQSNFTIPYCDERYSKLVPTHDGDFIMRILPTSMTFDKVNPYSKEVQDLLKITNLRINFTKLHTLGDDLLDSRKEIKEKYYYAIYEIVVGGSCSCYGHANKCVPLPGTVPKANMVHGQCECIHNTKGTNCEKCDDLYNDTEWSPALGKQTDACKKCNCNNHATSCHFESSVYELTGHTSGGVCDDCKHNTTGVNCEQCKLFYYQDPNKHYSDPDVCLKCDCDPAGSVDDGICDSRTDPAKNLISGTCHCKANVEGRRCDTCKNGFWNFTESNPLGCQPCSCNIYGTNDNQGCDKETGECTCKRNVLGRDCNQCVPEFWGLGKSAEGCKPCECNVGGSTDNYCDVIDGQCPCRRYTTGRTCNMTDPTFFVKSLDYMIYEAEIANCKGTCSNDIRTPYPVVVDNTWTGPGFARVHPNTSLEFVIDNIDKDLDYEIVIRYEPQVPETWDNVVATLKRTNTPNAAGICANKSLEETREISLTSDSRNVVIQPSVCLEAGQNYSIRLDFIRFDTKPSSASASILIDSIVLVPSIESIPFFRGSATAVQKRIEYEQARCNDYIYNVNRQNVSDICRAYHYSIGAIVHGGGDECKCDSTGSYSAICNPLDGYCSCKPNVYGRQCDRCAPGTYGFGPEGCKVCDCNSVGSLDNFCDVVSGQCKCRAQTYGRACDQCQPGSWNYPNCQSCVCHGHADVCDSRTGFCTDCRDSTEGHYCDRCIEGYYGDPRLNFNIPCRMCPCPGTIESGHSYASRCSLDSRTQDVVCECETGYSGFRCERCSENYYGNPDVVGGKCSSCNCSNNIDANRAGNCDPQTGQCLQCLYNTDGFNCEYCKSGYYGDALLQTCQKCVCSLLGTDSKQGDCNRVTGQCPCLPNVTGVECDKCADNHWKIASGSGCEPCACDPVGSTSEQCNEFDGQCTCKQGFGGRQCNQCQNNYWGNPTVQCYACECNPEGSATLQCHQNNGTCVCNLGIGGAKCDECARGFVGTAPVCNTCGECFDNWDLILNDLKERTNKVIESATEKMNTGVTGSYTKEFETMESKLKEIRQLLQNTTASTQQLQALDKLIADIRSGLTATEMMNNVSIDADKHTQRLTISDLELPNLNAKADYLNNTAQELKDNATKLQEGNIEGALNLTREAFMRAMKIKTKNGAIERTINDAKQRCKAVEGIIGRLSSQFNLGLEENEKNLAKLNNYLNDLEAKIPDLNQQICDKGGNPCNDLCGGAGCGFCGGLPCENGALTKAGNALRLAKDTEKLVNEKKANADELFRSVNQAKMEGKSTLNASQIAYRAAESAKNRSELAANKTFDMLQKLEKFLNSSKTTPAAIRNLASETLSETIQLKPEEITDLAQKINSTISSLSNIDAIIRNTTDDLNNAKKIKNDANKTKEQAENVLKVADMVVEALKKANVSQKLAEEAISMASENITLARTTLSQITDEINKAQLVVNGTMPQYAQLQTNFKKLQTEFLKNKADAQKVEEELKIVSNDVENAQKKTRELATKYQQTSEEVDKRIANSTEVYTSAQRLMNKASQLSANTTSKLKELQDYEKQYMNQEVLLNNITATINELTERMKNNYDEIRTKSNFYETCQ